MCPHEWVAKIARDFRWRSNSPYKTARRVARLSGKNLGLKSLKTTDAMRVETGMEGNLWSGRQEWKQRTEKLILDQDTPYLDYKQPLIFLRDSKASAPRERARKLPPARRRVAIFALLAWFASFTVIKPLWNVSSIHFLPRQNQLWSCFSRSKH